MQSRRSSLGATIAAVVAAAFIVLWLALVVLRIGYPYELEWMEGGMLDHIQRVRAGEALYAPPSLEFASYPYTPLFPWLAALAASALGDGFLAPRLLSVVATIVTLVLLALQARRPRYAAPVEGARLTHSDNRPRWLAGLLAAGLFAAGNQFVGGWNDLARVDALAMALGLGGLVVALAGSGPRAIGGAAILACLACLAKQSSLALALALAVAFLRTGWRPAVGYLVALGALLGASVLALELGTDGWFHFWTYTILANAPTHQPSVLGYWRECGFRLGPAFIVVALGWLDGGRRRPDLGRTAAVIALFATGWIGRSHEGGFQNNLLPPLVATALLFGPSAASWIRRRGTLAGLVVAAAFLPLVYDPRPMVPSAADRAAGDNLVARIAALGPPVLLPDHGYLLRRAFGPETRQGIHGMVINDLLKSGAVREAAELVTALEAALAKQTYTAVILDELWGDLPGLSQHYAVPEPLWSSADNTFVPVSGAPKRPLWLYRRR